MSAAKVCTRRGGVHPGPSMKQFPLILGIVALLACRSAAVSPGVSAGNDEALVRSVVAAFEDAWNRHDMEAFGELFADDADFVNVAGTRWQGRAAIKDAHVRSHGRQFRNSTLVIEETTVRFLAPHVAVARSTWQLTGHTTPAGEAGATRRGILTNVLGKSAGRWQIVVTQNTDITRPPSN